MSVFRTYGTFYMRYLSIKQGSRPALYYVAHTGLGNTLIRSVKASLGEQQDDIRTALLVHAQLLLQTIHGFLEIFDPLRGSICIFKYIK